MRPLLTALLVILPVASLAACSDDDPAAEAASSKPAYVALGDSYTAAPLLTEDSAEDGCVRSPTNYPHLVAEELGYDLDDVSCSGATTEDLQSAQMTTTGSVVPQLNAVGEGTDVVTLGIGGNDDGVFTRMIQCAATGSTDDSCRAGMVASIDALGDHLTQAIAAVREKAPEAQVVVVGYPQLLAADSTCGADLPVAPAAIAELARLNERIHTVQQAAAEAAEVPYADLFTASADHGVCSADPWINGSESIPGVGAAFHPNAAGQQAAADLVVAALDQA